MHAMATTDELCATCSKVDLFSLFTGPRYYPGDGFKHQVMIPLGTLADIKSNDRCPFCRLLHHDYLTETAFQDDLVQDEDSLDFSKVRVKVHPIRVDYHEEMKFVNENTRDMLATKLVVRLQPMDGLSHREMDLLQGYQRGNGIQLLSPDSTDPVRPLLNGYQATSAQNSLELLQQWMSTCVNSHTMASAKGTCCLPDLHDIDPRLSQYGIRVIDVRERTILERKPEQIDYAALSYVWGNGHTQDADLRDQGQAKTDAAQGSSSILPPKVEKVVEDAILVCKKLSIPYLWVDRHCINQADLLRKGSEIEGMGYRYLYAKITLIAGMGPEAGLLPEARLSIAADATHMNGLQKIETIQGRKYITCLPSIRDQIQSSQWINRSWTMQEGQLATRCAFFGKYDVSFLCGSGHWRESLHSGRYGHEAGMSDLELDCQGYYLLSRLNWLSDKAWRFEDYSSLLMSYTPRVLSFESDKLNAVAGCLNLIGDNNGISFVYGLPTMDFHYALLWTGEYDRVRDGFPSWSWAAWYSLQNSYQVYPATSGTCCVRPDEQGNLLTTGPVRREVELQGLYIALTERPPRANQCSQRFADITLPSHKTDTLLIIKSEVAHFFLDIFPHDHEPETHSREPPTWLDVPHDFDSTTSPASKASWDSTSEYRTPFARLRLRDEYGNTHLHHYPRWYDHWPPFKLNLPITLRGENMAWLLKDGIELVMILEVKLLEGDESLKPFHLVLCLGIDRRGKTAKRCGMFCLPKEIWDKACPKTGTVTIG